MHQKLPRLILLFLVLMACKNLPSITPAAISVQSSPTATWTATASRMPAFPESTPTSTNTPSPTTTSTNTPTATPTHTPTPTQTLIPTIPAEVINEGGEAILPAGFSLIKFADFNTPTGLAFSPDGVLYAVSYDGSIHALPDRDGDGRADEDIVVATGLTSPLGVEIHPAGNPVYVSHKNPGPDEPYVSDKGRIVMLWDDDGDLAADHIEVLVDGLPYGRHQNNNPKFGPDSLLYLGIGSTCDVCEEADERSAAILRFDIVSGAAEIVAAGLRNPYDYAWHPETGAMFATDNGRDDLGPEEPFEELNHIIFGSDYGFPECWDELVGSGCAGTSTAIGFFPARSSTNSLDFYSGSRFPVEYQNNLFAAVWGSYEAEIERGIYRIQLTPADESYQADISWFVQWPNAWLLGLIVGPDGALYVGDYINGGIWRISYGVP